MANDLTANPLVIDTSGAGDLLGASAPVRITAMKLDFAGAVPTDTQGCVVTDSAGHKLWSSTTHTTFLGAPDTIDFPSPLKAKGLKVPTLTGGGILYIYLDL
jgi:hypothetical protein